MANGSNKIKVVLISSIALIISSTISGILNYNVGYLKGEMDTKEKYKELSSEPTQSSINETVSEVATNTNVAYDESSSNESMMPEISSEASLESLSEIKDNIAPSLIMVDCKDQNAYEEYSGNGNNGFVMFGDIYTNGFTLSMGASHNIWGNGDKYVTYNVKSISQDYSVIKMLIGHIDGYSSDDVNVLIYLDKTIDQNPDYTYTISPSIAPQTISVDITGKSSMTVLASNQGGSDNKIGFANITFN